MRLIDADALLERMKRTNRYFNVKFDIEEAPTIEAEPVRHGRWEDKPTGAYGRYQSWCTACGKHSGIGGIESNRHKPYCPNCGAKMDAKTLEEAFREMGQQAAETLKKLKEEGYAE